MGQCACTSHWRTAYSAGPSDRGHPEGLHAATPDSVEIGIYLILPALFSFAVTFTDTVGHHALHRPMARRPH